jgi:hypothetical protein
MTATSCRNPEEGTPACSVSRGDKWQGFEAPEVSPVPCMPSFSGRYSLRGVCQAPAADASCSGSQTHLAHAPGRQGAMLAARRRVRGTEGARPDFVCWRRGPAPGVLPIAVGPVFRLRTLPDALEE